MRYIDLTGRVFSRLTVIGLSGEKTKSKHNFLLCKCICGNIVKTTSSALMRGNTMSCGCYRLEQISKAKKKEYKTNSKEYRAWAAIKYRIKDTKRMINYNSYLKKGIVMCERWFYSFEILY